MFSQLTSTYNISEPYSQNILTGGAWLGAQRGWQHTEGAPLHTQPFLA